MNMQNTNDFMRLRGVVNDAVTQYRNLRKQIKWDDAGKSSTIERLAKPFIDGYFTIAVAGKMSSGKSTFINSIIGENLLPTGHFQTTSAITWIVSSPKRFMEVTYADGHKDTITANFAKELKRLVAVPEKYDKLPINDINILISGGDDVRTILDKKPGIERKTKTSSPDQLWRDYIKEYPKSRIANEVVIYLTLPKEYEGWRIVDTPGIGAIGGIQDVTKKLLTTKTEYDKNQNVVDAVILLHKGSDNIQDESANVFAEEVRKSMGDLAEGRLFFVLTHSCSHEFQNYKDGILSRASNLFGKGLKIPDENIAYVDSLINRFINDAKKSGRNFANPESLRSALPGWENEDWSAIRSILLSVIFNLSCKELSNHTLFKALEDASGFENLNEMLNDFLNDEKERSFVKLMTLIEDELSTYGERLRSDIRAVSNGSAEIHKQIKGAQDEKNQLETALGKLRQKATPGTVRRQFAFVDQELETLRNKKTISEVRTSYLQTINKGYKAESELFEALKRDFSAYTANFNGSSRTITRSLDLDAIEKQATKEATYQVEDKSKVVRREIIEHGCCFSSDKYKDVYAKKDKINSDEQLRNFIAHVLREGRSICREYVDTVLAKSDCFFKIAKQNIDDKYALTEKRLHQYESDLKNKNQILSRLKTQLADVEKAQFNMKKFKD